jgi:hypothetical protein
MRLVCIFNNLYACKVLCVFNPGTSCQSGGVCAGMKKRMAANKEPLLIFPYTLCSHTDRSQG